MRTTTRLILSFIVGLFLIFSSAIFVYLLNCIPSGDVCDATGLLTFFDNIMIQGGIGLIVVIIMILHFMHDMNEVMKTFARRIKKFIVWILYKIDDSTIEEKTNTIPPQFQLENTIERHLSQRKKYTSRILQQDGHNEFIQMKYKMADESQKSDILSIYKHTGRLVITGTPGSGKTRVLQDLYLSLIREFDESKSIPLWININDPENPVDVQEMFEYRCQCYGLKDTFKHMLENDPPTILIDGLDELPIDTREERLQSLREWISTHPRIDIIVTCRLRDYQDNSSFSLGRKMTVIEVQPFGKEQIIEYMKAHLRADTRIVRNRTLLTKKQAQKLLNLVDSDDAVLHLAKTPLHLYMLTQLSIWGTDVQNLPRRLRSLYENYIKSLYEYEKTYRKRKLNYNLPYLTGKLEELAYFMIAPNSQDGSYALHRDKVLKIVNDKVIKDAVSLNLLVRSPDNPDILRFFHPMMHVYFALPQLKKSLESHSENRFLSKAFGRMIYKSYEQSDIIRRIGDLGDAAEMAVDALIDNIKDHDLPPKTRIATEHALVDIGIPSIKLVLRLLLNKDKMVRDSAHTIIRKIGTPCIGPLILYTARAENKQVDYQVSELLIQIGKEPMRELSKIVLARSNNEEFRAYVAEYLRNLTSKRAIQAVLPELIDMLKDKNAEVRIEGALTLRHFKEPVSIRPLIKMLKKEKNKLARVYAINAFNALGEEAFYRLLIALPECNRVERRNLQEVLASVDPNKTRREKIYEEALKTPINNKYMRKVSKYYARMVMSSANAT